MITDQEKSTISKLAADFSARKVLLFGSSSREGSAGRDIDLAVSGIAPQLFVRFYADLMWALSRPVDVVDLDKDSLFTRMIRREGVVLYEQPAR
jgi:predicted nucleotidyltransferase